jgi:hypothetical protein
VIRILPSRALLALAYMAGIFVLSGTPGRHLAALGLPFDAFQLLHVPLYAGLASVTLLALEGPALARMAVTVVVCMGYGLSDEWHQSFVPGRYFSVADLEADAIGVALGIALFEGFRGGTPALQGDLES